MKTRITTKITAASVILFGALPALAYDMASGAMGVQEHLASNAGWIVLGIALMMGVAVFGGTFSQSRAAIAAMEGIARNPSAAGEFKFPFILALALIESLVLFAFLLGILLTFSVTGLFG